MLKYCVHCQRYVKPKKHARWWLHVVIGLCTYSIWFWMYLLYYAFVKKSYCPKCNNILVESDNFDTKQNTPRKANIVAATSNDIEKYWIYSTEQVIIKGHLIKKCMFYFCKDSGMYNPMVINETLPVIENNYKDCKIRGIIYQGNNGYTKMNPKERGAYISWLESGKGDPSADIGYPILYFRGIEARLFNFVLNSTECSDEKNIILSELKILANTYCENDNYLLENKIYNLINFITIDNLATDTNTNSELIMPTYNQGIPINLKIIIGKLIYESKPIPANLALAWYFSLFNPGIYAKTPAHRCYEELLRLFTVAYTKRFNEGIKILPNKTKIKISYSPLNNFLNNEYTKKYDLPDIEHNKRIYSIGEIVVSCQIALDKYSRFLGRNFEQRNTIDALILLPVEAWTNDNLSKFNNLKTIIAHGPVKMAFSELDNILFPFKKITKQKVTALLEILEKNFSVGMEPDCRLGSNIPKKDTTIVLFSNTLVDLKEYKSDIYRFASLMVEISMEIIKTDGIISKNELSLLHQNINNFELLNDSLKSRLYAYAELLSLDDFKLRGITQKLTTLALSQKKLLGNIMIQFARINGSSNVQEIKKLEKFFKIMGLDKTSLYSNLNNDVSSKDLVTVLNKDKTNDNYRINYKGLEDNDSQPTINMERVEEIKKDTDSISEILSELFSDEDGEADEQKNINNMNNNVLGLPENIFKFVVKIISKDEWKRADLENIAAKNSFMLDGVLESINEAAINKYDDLLLEEDEKIIFVNDDIRREIINA